MNITITLTPAQVEAVALMGKNDKIAENIAASAAARIKGDIIRYRNGNVLPAHRVGEADHKISTTNAKTRVMKTVFYKGGLKFGAIKAYAMAKPYLPKEITEQVFINNAMAEVDLVIALLDATDSPEENEDDETAE